MLTDGRTALFSKLIDYAGIFPPASLSMSAAVDEYRTIRTADHAGILARFVSSTSRLIELAGQLTRAMKPGDDPWSLAVVFDQVPSTAASAAQAFATEMSGAAAIDLVEARLTADQLATAPASLPRLIDACGAISPGAATFIELPFASHPEAALDTLPALAANAAERSHVVGLKVRCGPTAAAVPSVETVAALIRWSHETGIPMKATAGLHHPIRRFSPDLGVHQHGFINVLTAIALSDEHSLSIDTLIEVVADTDPESFSVGLAGLQWRDWRASTPTIKKIRSQLFPSFGSCSFDEPIEELVELGLLA